MSFVAREKCSQLILMNKKTQSSTVRYAEIFTTKISV